MLMNMADLLKVAKENKFAVPAFNISDYAMLKGVMEACEELEAPVIIEIHPHELLFTDTPICKAVLDYANRTRIPVVLHLDHGDSYESCIKAIQNGFTSVMIDASLLPLEENIAITKKVIGAAHPVNVSVEAELGTVGNVTTREAFENQTILYTKVEDAIKFVNETGVDTLAVAIGTTHGLYPKGLTPHLKLDLLQEIKEAVNIPLVLHGGSGNADEEVAAAAKLGICKVNLSSDIKHPYFVKMREVLQDESLREPNKIEPPCIQVVKDVVKHKVQLLGDDHKAHLY